MREFMDQVAVELKAVECRRGFQFFIGAEEVENTNYPIVCFIIGDNVTLIRIALLDTETKITTKLMGSTKLRLKTLLKSNRAFSQIVASTSVEVTPNTLDMVGRYMSKLRERNVHSDPEFIRDKERYSDRYTTYERLNKGHYVVERVSITY